MTSHADSKRAGAHPWSCDRVPRRPSVILIIAALVAMVPAAADADAIKCKARIARESAAFVQTKMKALSGCHEFVVKHAEPGPCPDATAAATIAKAESKLRTRIARSCGGDNRVCGDGDDDPLATIGWDVGTCPDFGSAGCTNAIADCVGVADCLVCAGGAAVDAVIALTYDELAPSEPLTQLNSCQLRFGKETLRFVRATSKALQKCWDTVNEGSVPGPCPSPGDGRAEAALARAADKITSRVCAVCGGDDRACDGTDDIPPSEIGFPASCPAVTPPSGGSCGGSVSTLAELVECAECLSRHAVDCIDALAVPWAGAYPVSCDP